MRRALRGKNRRCCPATSSCSDTARPQRTFVADADYLSVAITRDAITMALPDVRPPAWRPCCPAGQRACSATSCCRSARHITTLSPALASESAGVAGTLLRSVIGGGLSGATPRNDASATIEMHRWRAEAFIDAHLDDRDLDVDAVAAGIGVARTTLYARLRARQRRGAPDSRASVEAAERGASAPG